MRIWKYPLSITDRQEVEIPQGARLLSVQMQNDQCCLWALCDGYAPPEIRRIAIYGTGTLIPDDPGKYLSTFQMHDGALVFHAFDFTDVK